MKHLLITLTYLALASCDLKSSKDYHREANKMEKQGKYQEAIQLLDKAIEKDPKNIKAILDRAVDKSMISDFKGAIDDYTRVIKIDPDNELALVNRGKNKKRIEDNIGAIEDFDKALSTSYVTKVENPVIETGFEYEVEIEEIRFERGIAYYSIDSLQKAFDDFNYSIERNFTLPDSYYWRGLIYLRHNMTTEGCKDLLTAQELGDPDAPGAIDKYCK